MFLCFQSPATSATATRWWLDNLMKLKFNLFPCRLSSLSWDLRHYWVNQRCAEFKWELRENNGVLVHLLLPCTSFLLPPVGKLIVCAPTAECNLWFSLRTKGLELYSCTVGNNKRKNIQPLSFSHSTSKQSSEGVTMTWLKNLEEQVVFSQGYFLHWNQIKGWDTHQVLLLLPIPQTIIKKERREREASSSWSSCQLTFFNMW